MYNKLTLFLTFIIIFQAQIFSTETIDELTKQIKKNPKSTHLFYRRAQAYFSQQDYKSALSDIDTALKSYSDSNYYLKSKVKILLALEKPKQAEEIATKVISQPNESLYAFLCEQTLNVPEANTNVLKNGFTYVEKYIEKHPNEFEPLRIKTLLYIYSNDRKKAIEIAKQAMEKNPNDPNAKINLANAYTLDENYEEAKKLLEKSNLKDPARAYALNHIAYQLITYNNSKLQRPEKSLELVKTAIDICKTNCPDILDTYALALFKNKFVIESIEMQKKAIESLKTELKEQNRPINRNIKIREFEDQLHSFEDSLKKDK